MDRENSTAFIAEFYLDNGDFVTSVPLYHSDVSDSQVGLSKEMIYHALRYSDWLDVTVADSVTVYMRTSTIRAVKFIDNIDPSEWDNE